MSTWDVGSLRLTLPSGWTASEVGAVALGPWRGDPLRATLVHLQSEDTRGIERMSAALIEEILQTPERAAQVVGVDVWAAQTDAAGTTVPGRMMTYGLRMARGAYAEIVTWLWVTGTHRVQLTATVPAGATLVAAAELHDAVVGARLAVPALPPSSVRLEGLDGIASRQRYEPRGGVVPATAVTAAASDSPEGESALAALGGVTDGAVNGLGRALRSSREADVVVTVRAQARGGHTAVTARRVARGYVVEAGPPVWRLLSGDPGPWGPGEIELEAATPDLVVPVLASWVGLTPTWQLAMAPIRIPRALLAAKIADPATPEPRGIDRVGHALWEQAWAAVALETTIDGRSAVPLQVVRAGDIGTLDVVAGDDDVVELTPIRSATLYHRLHRVMGTPVTAEALLGAAVPAT